MLQREAQKQIIVFVDHGGLNALKHHHPDKEYTPDDLKALVRRRGPIHKALLFTDDPRLGRTDATRQETERRWHNAGFECILCPRSGMLAQDKETIDAILIEAVHDRLGMIPDSDTERWHFLFIVGDSDYRAVIQTVLNRGIQTSAFLTVACAILQPGTETQLYEIYELYPKIQKGDTSQSESGDERPVDPVQSAQDARTAFRRLGRSAHRLYLTEPEQRVLDITMGSAVRCVRCGKEMALERYTLHTCYPNRLFAYECTPPTNGPSEAGLLTRAYAEDVASWINGRGAKEVIPWYYWQATRDVLPEQFGTILSLVDRLSWAVVDTAFMLRTCEEEPLPASEIETRYPLAIMSVARDLELLIQADNVFHSTTGDLAGFRPLIDEAIARSRYPIISRLIDPDYASREEDMQKNLLLPPDERESFIRELETRMTQRLSEGSNAVTFFSWEEALLYISQDVPRVSYDGYEILCTLYRGEERHTRTRLMFDVLMNIREHPQETGILEMAERLLEQFPEGQRSLRFLDILIHTGVLEQVDERLRGTRPSHPAFQLLNYVQQQTIPSIPSLTP